MNLAGRVETLSEPKLTGVALHEAGHILVGSLYGYECADAWITPTGAGQAQVGPEPGEGSIEAEICISLAGYVAQGISLDDDFLLGQIAATRKEVWPEDHFDVRKAFRRMIAAAPKASDIKLLSDYRHFETLTRDKLNEIDNRARLERIARDLQAGG